MMTVSFLFHRTCSGPASSTGIMSGAENDQKIICILIEDYSEKGLFDGYIR